MLRHTVLFNGYNASHQFGLWATDGTAAGTFELTGIIGANTGMLGLGPTNMTVFRPGSSFFAPAEVLFNGVDASGNNGLWVTNGTAAGTHEITGITGAAANFPGLDPRDMTVFNGEVLFSGLNATFHFGLWVTNGTAAGTHEV